MESAELFESNSYLSFRIGTEIFGASVKNVISILEITKITKVPKAPDHMKGVMNLRGSVLPVIDTRIKLGISELGYTDNTCILVMEIMLKSESMNIGAIVDGVQEVLEIKQEDIQPPPSIGLGYQSDVVSGMTKKDEEFIMLLDLNKLFAQEAGFDKKEVVTEE